MTDKPKIRADARELAAECARYGVDVADLPAGPDGWHSRASIEAVVREKRLVVPSVWNSIPLRPSSEGDAPARPQPPGAAAVG